MGAARVAVVPILAMAVLLWARTDADMRSADLRSADLRSADLTGANLAYVNLRDANMSGACMGQWERGPDGYARRINV